MARWYSGQGCINRGRQESWATKLCTVVWRLIFEGPQYAACRMVPYRRLGFWSGWQVFEKPVYPWLGPSLFSDVTRRLTTHTSLQPICVTLPSFGGEVKPSVPCRSFTACKRYINVTFKSAFRQNSRTFLALSSTFRRWVLSRGDTRGDAWWRKLERLTQIAQ